ncbi:p21-C-terminal region-binding protein-domain-containing protein [Cryomyces antarcticus]|nr:Mss4p nuclear export [Oleoguttula sp. CCFEE 6159]
MAKRKQVKDEEALEDAPPRNTENDGDDSGSSDDEDTDMLDVEFEWFDPQPEVDFHGLKTLLRQLFDVDNQLFDLSALTDLILSQPLLGSTVKVDGNESDPYAFLTVLNLHEHRDKQVIKDLMDYLSQKASSHSSMSQLPGLLSLSSKAQVGLILTERFVNMPTEVVPPMYNMLLEEIKWAIEEKEPYSFSHYLILSKTYAEVASKLDQEESRPKKKNKAAKDSNTFYFHPEDEVLQKHASSCGSFEYTKQGDEGAADSKRTFQELGIRPRGHLILIEGPKFESAVKAVGEYLSPQS